MDNLVTFFPSRLSIKSRSSFDIISSMHTNEMIITDNQGESKGALDCFDGDVAVLDKIGCAIVKGSLIIDATTRKIVTVERVGEKSILTSERRCKPTDLVVLNSFQQEAIAPKKEINLMLDTNISLLEIVRSIRTNARNKGYDFDGNDQHELRRKIMLAAQELSVEAIATIDNGTFNNPSPKMNNECSLGVEEVVDAVIRALHILDANLGNSEAVVAAILRKMDVNSKRPFLHGKLPQDV